MCQNGVFDLQPFDWRSYDMVGRDVGGITGAGFTEGAAVNAKQPAISMKMKIIILTATALAVACSALLSIRARHITNAILHPGYGACGRCNKTWDVVSGHNTPYEWSKPGEMHMLISGENVPATNIFGGSIPKELAEYLSKPRPTRLCFPLCKQCWQELKTPVARLPYYRALLNNWKQDDPKWHGEELWEDMKASVLAGN